MKRKLPIAQMNVVPYIDVMLVLLVIFMVTAPLVQTTTIDIPQTTAPARIDAPTVDVQVNWLGGQEYEWTTPDGQKQRVRGDSALVQAVQQKTSSIQGRKPMVVFGAGENERYGAVVAQIDVLRERLPDAQIQLLMKRKAIP